MSGKYSKSNNGYGVFSDSQGQRGFVFKQRQSLNSQEGRTIIPGTQRSAHCLTAALVSHN